MDRLSKMERPSELGPYVKLQQTLYSPNGGQNKQQQRRNKANCQYLLFDQFPNPGPY